MKLERKLYVRNLKEIRVKSGGSYRLTNVIITYSVYKKVLTPEHHCRDTDLVASLHGASKLSM